MELELIERFEFYRTVQSPEHVLTIQTADQRLFANLLLTIGVRKKGVLPMVTLTKPIAVDAHQHFWDLKRFQYPGMTDDMTALRRNYLPGGFAAAIGPHRN